MTPIGTPFGTPFAGALPLLLFLARATVLLAVALVATIPLRRATAGARHLLWLAALVGVIALPLLGRVAPLRVGVLPQAFGSAVATVQAPAPAADAVTPAPLADATTSVDAPALPQSEVSSPATPAPRATISMPALAPLQIVAIVWAGVALALLGWLVAGALSVRRIARTGDELTSPDWTTPLCEVADRLDLDIVPRLVVSDEIEMAFACRALAPTIVLPAAAREWSDDRRRAVLMHELAHVKRHDLIGHAFGRIACALYWFHPLVWVAAKNLRAESERACDDLVLSCGTRASEYAQHLLDMVTSVRRHGAPVMALPMARKREFEGRMLAILDPAIHRASPGRLQAAAVVATVGVLSLTIAAVAPAAPASVPVAAPRVDQAHRIAATAETVHVARGPQPMSQPLSQVARQVTSSNADGLAKPLASVVATAINSAFHALGGQSNAKTAGTDTARVTLLVHILGTDADAQVRRTAAWALQDAQRTDARTALIKALRGDSSSSVRETAAWALGDYTGDDVVAALDGGLRDKDAEVRGTSAWAIGTIGVESEAPALGRAATDSSAHVKEFAIWALGNMNLHTAPPGVAAALGDKSSSVREIAAWALGTMEDASAAPALVSAFQTEQSSKVRSAELWALTSMGKASDAVLDIALKSPDPELRRHAVSLLAGGSDAAWPWPWPWPWPRPFPD
ncbi:MAG TPA: M56 family metallopeptidase [Gemmatimonadaceae bacterium]